MFQLPRLNIAGLKVDFTRLLSAIDFGALSWPEVTLPNLTLGGGVNWLNLGLSDLLLQLKGLNLPGISFTLPSAWPNGAGGTSLSGIKLPDLKLALPDIDLDWANLTLPELLLSLPRLNIAGLSIDIDYARLLPAWPNVSLPNLGDWFKSNPTGAGATGGLSLNLDWSKLSLPELLISLPKLNLPGFDLGLLGFGGLPSFNSASLSKLPLIGSLIDDLPFKFNFNDDGFSIYGQLGIQYQDNFTLSGTFGLDKNTPAGTISFLAQDATAKLQVGEYGLGAQGADVALVLEASGFALEAKGELYAQFADFVKLSADTAAVRINTTGKDYTGTVVTVGDPADGGLTHTFGTLTNGTRGVALTNASLSISDFVRISGNVDATDTTSNVTARATNGTTSALTGAKVLTFGGSNLSAFAGNGATSQKLGLEIGDLDFALAFITETLSAGSTATARSWAALKANAGNISLVGVDSLTLSANTLSLEINRAAADGSLIDFAVAPLAVPVGGGQTISINHAAAEGALLRVSGTMSLAVAGFVSVSGSFAVERSQATVVLSSGEELAVNLLRVGASSISAFAGINGTGADKLGFDLSQMDFALALMTDQGNEARKWMALQGSAGQAAFVGVDGLTVTAQSLDLAINRNLSTQGSAQAQPDKKLETILRLDTDLTTGTLVLGLGASQVAMALAAGRTAESTRNELRRKLEELLKAADPSRTVVDGEITVTGDESAGLTVVFGGSLAGTDFSGLTISTQAPQVGAQVSEVTTGAAAQNNVTLSAQTQNTRLGLNLASAQAGTLRFGYEGATQTVSLTSAQTDATLINAIDAALEGLAGIGANAVTVTGTRAGGFTIDVAGARAGQDVSGITLNFEPQVATASVSLTQQGEVKQTGVSTTGTNVRERQVISFSGATTNTGVRYTLGKSGGAATAAIDFSRSSPTQNRATLQSELNKLYGAGNVTVTFDQTSTAASPKYFIDFTGALAYQNVAPIEVRSQTGVTVTVSTSQEGSSVTRTPTTQAVSAIQKVTLANTQAGGTFTLSFKVGASTYTTAALAMTATAAQVQAALSALSVTGLSSAASFTVTAITGGYQVIFGGGLAGQAIAPMTVKVTPPGSTAELTIVQKGFTRSVSQTVTTAGVNETQSVEINAGGTTGSFTLSLAHSGTTYTTGAIKFGAKGTEVQQALLKAFADGGVSGAQVTVSQKGSGSYEVTFGGALGAANLSLMKASAKADNPTAQLTVVQAGASVAQPALQASVDANLVVDFGVQSLTVKTGPSTSRTLTLDGSVG
ncbi:MAG: hypothetical protein KGN78_12970, partial [Actinomycetales bacterium]|nr:hypothetical protein [Actinomycetales bacterium]